MFGGLWLECHYCPVLAVQSHTRRYHPTSVHRWNCPLDRLPSLIPEENLLGWVTQVILLAGCPSHYQISSNKTLREIQITDCHQWPSLIHFWTSERRSCVFTALTLLVGRQEEHLTCKNGAMRCWCGCLSGARCRLFALFALSSWCHCHPKTPSSLALFKSILVLFFWYRLTQVVLEKKPLNGCIGISSSSEIRGIGLYVSCVWGQGPLCI